jgi:hypothetical protein
VLAGCGNTAADFYTAVIAGRGNQVGHGDFLDFDAEDSMIGAGSSNYLDNAGDSFIGAGSGNTLGLFGAGFNVTAAAIVAGSGNTQQGPSGFIGGGDRKSIVSIYDQYNSTSAFIGAGDSNAILGLDSSIVGGSGNAVKGATAGSVDRRWIQERDFSRIRNGRRRIRQCCRRRRPHGRRRLSKRSHRTERDGAGRRIERRGRPR